MSVYLALELFAIIIPLLFSYDRKLQFYRKIKAVALSLVMVGFFYIIVDILFTKYGVWGFNPIYHSGIVIAGLPLEEWIFFIVIPYASLFLHDTLIYLFPGRLLNNQQTSVVSTILIIFLLTVVFKNTDKVYTAVYGSVAIFAIILTSVSSSQLLNRFYLTFIVILIPFFLVNSILTGSFIPQEVVWYNNSENLGIRIFTVPVEDISYAFSLILFNLLLVSKLEVIFLKKTGDG
ncbi:MAG: lycopene cyclase domain-containing protein [Mariniphaga sp.]